MSEIKKIGLVDFLKLSHLKIAPKQSETSVEDESADDAGTNIDASPTDSSRKGSASGLEKLNTSGNSISGHGETNNFSRHGSTGDQSPMKSGGSGPGGFRMRLAQSDKSQGRNEDDKSENVHRMQSPASSPQESTEERRMPQDARTTGSERDAGSGHGNFPFNRDQNRMRNEGLNNRRDYNRGDGMTNRRGDRMDNRSDDRGERMDNRRGDRMENRSDDRGDRRDGRGDRRDGRDERMNGRRDDRSDRTNKRSDNNGDEQNAGSDEGRSEAPKPAPVTYIPPDLDESEGKLFEGISQGENFEKFGEYNVEVTGEKVPNYCLDRFEDAKVVPTIMNNIARAGYTYPTPIQKWAIPIILEGRDMMACAQTGSGKTAAFLIPVLSRIVCADDWLMKASASSVPTPLVLILSPTRELAIQTHRECRKFAYETIVSATCVYGGVQVGHQLGQLQKRCHVVVATVGRIGDFVRNGKIDLSQVRYLILDEADRMLDLGFNNEVTSIIEKCGGLKNKNRQTLLFSATFPVEIQELAGKILNDYIFVTIGSVGQANRDIKQIVWKVDKKKKRELLMEVLKDIGSEKVIVFVQTKRMVDALCISLSEFMDIPMTAIHGDLDQKEREEVLGYFREGKATVLMATSVAARGLDINNVKHVINYDLPTSIDEYIHRIGRTARCGHVGRALSFFSEIDDAPMARSLIKILSDARQDVPAWLEDLASSSVGVGGFHKDATTTRDARRNGQVPPSSSGSRGYRQNQPPPPSKHPAVTDQAADDDDYWA